MSDEENLEYFAFIGYDGRVFYACYSKENRVIVPLHHPSIRDDRLIYDVVKFNSLEALIDFNKNKEDVRREELSKISRGYHYEDDE